MQCKMMEDSVLPRESAVEGLQLFIEYLTFQITYLKLVIFLDESIHLSNLDVFGTQE